MRSMPRRATIDIPVDWCKWFELLHYKWQTNYFTVDFVLTKIRIIPVADSHLLLLYYYAACMPSEAQYFYWHLILCAAIQINFISFSVILIVHLELFFCLFSGSSATVYWFDAMQCNAMQFGRTDVGRRRTKQSRLCDDKFGVPRWQNHFVRTTNAQPE